MHGVYTTIWYSSFIIIYKETLRSFTGFVFLLHLISSVEEFMNKISKFQFFFYSTALRFPWCSKRTAIQVFYRIRKSCFYAKESCKTYVTKDRHDTVWMAQTKPIWRSSGDWKGKIFFCNHMNLTNKCAFSDSWFAYALPWY